MILRFSFWLVLYVVFIGCTKKDQDKVQITIHGGEQNSEVRLSIEKNLIDTVLFKSQTDSLGQCKIELNLHEPMFVLIQIGKKYAELYLAPGYDLNLIVKSTVYTTPLQFSGTGAEVNNYVSWVNSNQEKIKWAGGRGLSALNEQEFLKRYDSLKATLQNFHDHYFDSIQLDDQLKKMLEVKNRIKLSEAVQEFQFYKQNNAANEKRETEEKGKQYLAAHIIKELENLQDEMPLDTTLFSEGFDYKILLTFYWHNKVNLPAGEIIENGKIERVPFITHSIIKNADIPEGIREYLLAYNYQNSLLLVGITPASDSAFMDFKKTYVNSKYLPALNRRYAEWLALSPGKPAPTFTATTLDGKEISLADLKGKIVYIDVWATWCGPCKAEIPASKDLQKVFEKNDQVVFLNVSVDSRKSDWEKFFKNDESWKGLHVIIPSEKINSLYQTYKLHGVPDYILIDQAGNIVTIKAPRPSTGLVAQEINKLLKEKV